MGGHHLILGELTDFITGEPLDDTLDERYRQELARLLVDERGYDRSEIVPRTPLTARAGEQQAMLKIDLTVSIGDRVGMMIRFGPGSLVTRRRPSLAASRLLTGYQIPVVVITNGEDAEVLDGETGKVIGTGLDAIPDREFLGERMAAAGFTPVSPDRAERESRILFSYDVDGSCPCDDTICRT